MKAKPFVSIVVASYNHEKYIKKTLDSLFNQSYKNFEVIVVDDGSQDKSCDIIMQYANNYHNIRFFQHPNNENRGLPTTVRLGIEKACGEWIAFCESDDFWTENYLEQKIKFIEKHPQAHIIGSSLYCIGDYILSYRRKKWITDLEHILKECNPNFFVRMVEGNKIPTFSCWMAKKKDLLKLDFKHCITYASLDYWLTLQLTFKYTYYFLNKKLTFWRQHCDSYYQKEKNNAEKEKELFIKKLLEIIRNCSYKKGEK